MNCDVRTLRQDLENLPLLFLLPICPESSPPSLGSPNSEKQLNYYLTTICGLWLKCGPSLVYGVGLDSRLNFEGAFYGHGTLVLHVNRLLISTLFTMDLDPYLRPLILAVTANSNVSECHTSFPCFLFVCSLAICLFNSSAALFFSSSSSETFELNSSGSELQRSKKIQQFVFRHW